MGLALATWILCGYITVDDKSLYTDLKVAVGFVCACLSRAS